MKQEKNKKVCMFVWNNFIKDARVYRECLALKEAGYDVILICLRYQEDSLPEEEVRDGIEIIRIRTKSFYNKSLLIKLVAYILPIFKMSYIGRKVNANIYHSNDLNTLFQGVIGSKFRFRKKSLVYDSHEVQTDRTGYINANVKKYEQVFLKFIDRMIMTTDIRAIYTSNLYGIKKPYVIHNYPIYYDNSEISPINIYNIFDVKMPKPLLLYQGGVQEGRGLENLIKAMKSIDRGILVLIGDGDFKKTLLNLVDSLNLNDKVKFLPAVSMEELKNYTVSAQIGFQVVQNTCFNHYSALSNKLFEYIMAEVPVIVSNLPEMRKVVESTGVGLVIDTTSPENIAKNVNILLNDNALYKKCKKNCSKYKYKYCWDKEKDYFIQIYRELR